MSEDVGSNKLKAILEFIGLKSVSCKTIHGFQLCKLSIDLKQHVKRPT